MNKKIFLPAIHSGKMDTETCGMEWREADIFNYMKNAILQERSDVICQPVLVAVARAKAFDLAVRGYEHHVDPEGHGANWLLKQAGYRLPSSYNPAPSANNVESCGWGGSGEPQQMWDSWMSSSHHRTHLLGQNDTHRPQIMVGVGHVYRQDSRQGHYWVVLSAHPEV